MNIERKHFNDKNHEETEKFLISPLNILPLINQFHFNDMRIIVPKIINLFTALVNVHEFKHAYDVYSVLGKKVSDEDASLYEKNAIDKEKEFVKSYLPDKYFSSGK